MKKVLLFTALSIFAMRAEAQKCKPTNVPAPVMSVFTKSYPATKKACWGKDGVNYIASFYAGKTNLSVTYDATGKRILTEKEILASALPKEIVEYMQKNYPGDKFLDIAQVIDAEETVIYEIQVRDLDVVFDSKGTFMQVLKCFE